MVYGNKPTLDELKINVEREIVGISCGVGFNESTPENGIE